jgi:phosphoribosylglycinamide formyltransferase-1
MIRIAVFASGAGSNTAKIIEYFKNHPYIRVGMLVSNNPAAGVLEIASVAKIPVAIIEREEFFRGSGYVPLLKEHHIAFIVLAGFLWKIPASLIGAYPSSIINIHPALLPAHGGKGMYGMNVHEAVIRAGDRQSGITIHYVDGQYDNGDIIFQERCDIAPGETPASLAQKIHALEYVHFPRIIEEVIDLQNQR